MGASRLHKRALSVESLAGLETSEFSMVEVKMLGEQGQEMGSEKEGSWLCVTEI